MIRRLKSRFRLDIDSWRTNGRARLSFMSPRLAQVDQRTAAPVPKTADPFYLSSAWRSLIAKLIAERGRRCQDTGCGRVGCRLFGDHVVELKDGGDPLNPSNVLLRCGACHTRKTARERERRMRGGG